LFLTAFFGARRNNPSLLPKQSNTFFAPAEIVQAFAGIVKGLRLPMPPLLSHRRENSFPTMGGRKDEISPGSPVSEKKRGTSNHFFKLFRK
jgi:hypothetical protein